VTARWQAWALALLPPFAADAGPAAIAATATANAPASNKHFKRPIGEPPDD
jgi:hypothetical protein